MSCVMLSVIILGSSEHAVRRRGASSGVSESGWMKERWPASGAAAAAGLYAVRISRVNSPLMYLRLGLYRPHVRAGGGAPPPAPPPPVHSYIRSSCARPVVVVDVVRALMFVVQLIWLLWLWCVHAHVRYGDLCTDGETAQARAQPALVVGSPRTQESQARRGE